MPFPGNRHKKIHVLAGIMAGILVLYSVRLLSLQVLSADRYASQASGVSTRVAVLKAPRGEILDCYGRKIAVNRDGYNIVFNSAYLEKSTLNDLILTLCRYLESMEVEWNDKLPLSRTAPYSFTESDNAFLFVAVPHFGINQPDAADNLRSQIGLHIFPEGNHIHTDPFEQKAAFADPLHNLFGNIFRQGKGIGNGKIRRFHGVADPHNQPAIGFGIVGQFVLVNEFGGGVFGRGIVGQPDAA